MSKELHTLHVNNTLQSFLAFLLLPLLTTTFLADAEATTQEDESSDECDDDRRPLWY